MRFTPFIAAAMLAYTAVAAPVQLPTKNGQASFDHDLLNIGVPEEFGPHRRDIQPSKDEQMGPIPHAVSPNGLLGPVPDNNQSFDDEEEAWKALKAAFEQGYEKDSDLGGPETTSTGLPFDSHPDNVENFPTTVDTDAQKNATDANQSLARRNTLFTPEQVDAYKVGSIIDLKMSMLELNDKLVYLNRNKGLTMDEANRKIDTQAQVIGATIRRNFLQDAPDFGPVLQDVQQKIAAEIEAHPPPPNSTLTEHQIQNDLGSLHAYYLVVALESKIETLARKSILDKTTGRRAVSATRDMIKITTGLSKADCDNYLKQVEMIEIFMRFMVQKHHQQLPSSILPEVSRPAAFEFGQGKPSVSARSMYHNNDNDNSRDGQPDSITNAIQTRDVSENQTNETEIDPDSFWSDFGAPECMHFLEVADGEEGFTAEHCARFAACQERVGQLAPLPKTAGQYGPPEQEQDGEEEDLEYDDVVEEKRDAATGDIFYHAEADAWAGRPEIKGGA
ncbi:hypothetical protein LZ554_008614 [Drepanopeziza brunnea f. sp. 'monogermtubi']|nr:hypothetical protein LZ554_008614 [Drepanopeziza brunnea f. sp. 'monogermtubi']